MVGRITLAGAAGALLLSTLLVGAPGAADAAKLINGRLAAEPQAAAAENLEHGRLRFRPAPGAASTDADAGDPFRMRDDQPVDLSKHQAGVPEPATWALTILGVGMLGVVLRLYARQDRKLRRLEEEGEEEA